MESRRPKRRKDKYNPYEICEKNGKYYISFKSNEEIQNCIEIERTLYDGTESCIAQCNARSIGAFKRMLRFCIRKPID